MPAGDVILRAEAIKTVNKYKYIIEYYYDDVIDEEKTEELQANYNEMITSYPDKNIDGYELDGEKTGNINLIITDNESNNIIKVYYKMIIYNINYDLVGGNLGTTEQGEEITNPSTYTVKTEDITLNNPTKPGYIFLGWTGSNGDTPNTEVKILKGSTGDKEFVANWRARTDIEYKVQHYIEELEEDTYSLHSEEIFTGTMGAGVTAEPITIDGFTYNDIRSQVTKSGVVKADGSLVLKLYYSRNSYKLKIVAGENISKVYMNDTEESETEIEKVFKYGQSVSIKASLEQTEGYITVWKLWESSNNKNDLSNITDSVVIPAEDLVLTAKADKEKDKFEYVVKYFYDGIEDESQKVTKKAEFESQIISYEDKVKDGYEFDKVENLPLTITANSENNIINVYYKLIEYTITYNLDGGTLGTDEQGTNLENPSTYTVKSEDITLINPKKDNFLFLGWTGGTTKENPGTTGNLETPTKDVTIKQGSMGDRTYVANWEELTYQVIVHHYLEGTGPENDKEAIKLAEDEIFTSHILGEEYVTNHLIPEYDENGNIINTDGREYIDGKEYYVVNTPENASGEYTDEIVEVYYYYQHYPVIRIVSSPAEELNGTEYITIEDALNALKNAGLDVDDDISKLEVLRDVKDEAVLVENQNVEIDLKGFTISSSSEKDPTIKLDNSKATIIDTSELGSGKVISENGIGVYIKADSEFTLGIEEKPVELSPEIIASTKGIEKETTSDGKQGTFNFFDGKIVADQAIEGIVDLTPLLYNATITVNDDGKQVSILAVISDAEARIGRKTYTLLEDAVSDANTIIGADGSQVEVTILKDITKSQRLVIDSDKNIKLDLAGYTLTSTAQDYVIENRGDLEIVDSSSTPSNPNGTGKIISSTYSTILNSIAAAEEIKEYTASDLSSNSTYKFVEKDGKLVSNNNGVNSSNANSYIKIDLSANTGEYVLKVDAEISSQTADYGYATITNNTSVPSYSNTNGRFIYISGEQESQEYMTTLYGGNVYYLHLGYYKNNSVNDGDDEFRINSITLNNKEFADLTLRSGTYKLEAQGLLNNYYKVVENNGNLFLENNNSTTGNVLYNSNIYNFDITDGVLKSNNTQITNSLASSYVEIDLTNKPGTHTVVVNAEIVSRENDHFGYATIKETKAVPEYKDEEGRFVYISGSIDADDYSIELEGGKKYYLHLGYYKDSLSVYSTDQFTVNSIKVDGNNLELEKEVSPYLYAEKIYTNLVKGEGNVYLNSGILKTEKTTGAWGIEVDGNVEINGGSISTTQYSVRMPSTVKSGSTITINNGTISCDNIAITNLSGEKIVINNLYVFKGKVYNDNSLNGEIIINDGIYNSDIENKKTGKIEINSGIYNATVRNENNGIIDINGGTFYGTVVNTSAVGNITINEGLFNKRITNTSSGDVNITNGTINAETDISVYNQNNGTINIYGGNITSSTNTVYNNNRDGTINIYGGTIESTGTDVSAVYNNLQGSINIGDNDEEIKDIPIISAASGYGVKNINGTLNYYDGIIKGKEDQSIYGQVSEIPENTEINISYEVDNSVEVSTLVIPSKAVAQIGDKTYTTLQSAIDACEDNVQTTIKVIDNIYISNTNVVPENKDIILDLNSCRIKSLTDDTAIENNGSLEIIDNSSLENAIDLSTKVDSGTYGFNLEDNKLISTNKNINDSSSISMIPIDLRNYTGVARIVINTEISSNSADYGWAILTESTDTPTFATNENGYIFRISGQQEATDYDISLSCGRMYYLHVAYIKNRSYSSYDDTFTINSVTINNGEGNLLSHGGSIITNNSNLNLGNIDIKIDTEGKSDSYKTGILNKGTMEINGANITSGTSIYTEIITNDETGTIEMNSGNIEGTSSSGVIGIHNISEAKITVNGGTIYSRIGIKNDSTENVTINSGNIKGVGDSAIYSTLGDIIIENGNFTSSSAHIIKTAGGTVTINDGLFYTETSGYMLYVIGPSQVTINNATAQTAAAIMYNDSANGNIIIKDGTYTTGTSTCIVNDGTIDIQGGTFTGKGLGIQNNQNANITFSNASLTCLGSTGIDNSGTFNFVSGSLTNTNSNNNSKNIYNRATGTLTLGLDDGDVKTDYPSITNNVYGIYNYNGTFNFYDGIITAGANKTIYGTVSDQADGYEIIKTINEDATVETAILDLLPIAKVVSTGYEYNTIQEAVEACSDNTHETIQILRDSLIVETVPSVEIPASKNITLDINGYELSAGNKDTFVNKGNLEIIDSSALQMGLLKNTSYSLFSNEENGNITFTSGNIATTAETYKDESGVTYKCYLAVNKGEGTITINGSELTALYGISNEATGEVIMQEGILQANSNSANYIAINNVQEGKITVKGGSISGFGQGICNVTGEVNVDGESIINTTNYGISSIGEGKVYITGGEICGVSTKIYVKDAYLEVNGGTIGKTTDNGVGINAVGSAQVVIKKATIATNGNSIVIKDSNTSLKILDGTFTSPYNVIYNYGNMEITGGNFSATNKSTSGSIIETSEKSVSNISNCVISSVSTSTSTVGILNKGTMQIGENTTINIDTDVGTIIRNTGTLTLGIDDGEIKNDSIMLNGGAIGVDTKGISNVFNYYDGTITAKEILKGEVSVPSGYTIDSISENDKYIAKIGKLQGIVQIGDTIYDSLQEAINEVPDNEENATTIKVLKSYVTTLTDLSTVESSKNVILDLDGYEITNYGGILNNEGSIEIIDTSEGKTAIISGYANNLISNTGSITINVNIIQNRNYMLINNSLHGNVKIAGGNIVVYDDSENYNAIYVIYSTSTGNIEITGGDILADVARKTYFIYTNNTETDEQLNIIITGGNIHSMGNGTTYGIYVNYNTNANIEISNVNIDVVQAIYTSNLSGSKRCDIEITSGTIKSKNTTIDTASGTNVKLLGGEIITNNSTGYVEQYSGILITSGATLEMSGGTITSNTVCGIINSGTTTITGGKIESLNGGIYTRGGTVNMLGGEINVTNSDKEQYGIYMTNSAIVNLGTKEYPVSRISPSIKSGKYGVYCNGTNAVFNFYDGIIEGDTKAIYGTVSDTPELYTVQLSNGEKQATLGVQATFERVAVMNGIYYNSLQTAIDSAGTTPSEIRIETDNVISEPVIIKEGQDITIDLYGNSIILPEGSCAIENNGTLTIIDTLVEEGEEIVSRVENYSGVAIQNNGTLTLGIDDGVENEKSPFIKGGITGEGKVTKYDGVIE